MSTPALRVVPSFNAANIPAELQQLPQWGCWRREQRGDGKPSKMPYDPRTGAVASVTDREAWRSFDEAVQAATSPGSTYDGIGFLLTRDDPYAIIDLDDCEGDAVTAGIQTQVYEHFDSYSELSPSGRGLHIVVRGTVDCGRRRGKIELYSSERYMTFTGDIYGEPRPIMDRQPLVAQLWAEMSAGEASAPIDASQFFRAATADDDTIYARAAAADNGDKFVRLWNGDGSALPGADKSGSAIDMALVDILAFHTKDPAQIERLWLRSPQGQRDKTQRRDKYRRDTIARAFDRELPQLDPASGALAQWGEQWRALQAGAAGATTATIPASRYKLYSGADLRALPPLQWRVKGILPTAGLAVIYGPSTAGKSFLAFDLACAIAEGLPWFGFRTKPANVLYLALEGLAGFRNRVAAWETKNARDLPDGVRLILDTFKFRNAADVQALASLCPHGAVIFVDTLARAGDDDPNDPKERAELIDAAMLLQSLTQSLVVLIAHTGKDETKGISGAKKLFDTLDASIFVSRKDDARTWKADKVKDGKDNTEFQFALGVVFLGLDDDGEPVTSCAIEPIGAAPNEPTHRLNAEADADDIFLRLLAEFTAQGQDVSPAPSSPTYAPKLFAARPGVGYKRDGFAAAMNRLISSGRIRIGKSKGAPSKARDILVLASPASEPASLC